MWIVECWLEHPVRDLDQTFSYLSEKAVEPGCRVIVPLNTREVVGFVESAVFTAESEAEIKKRLGFALKHVSDVLDEESLLSDELHALALWMRRETLSPAISCFSAMLPGKVKPRTSKQKAVTERWVRVSDASVDLTPKQLEAYSYVAEKGAVRYSDLRSLYPHIARKLIENGAVVQEVREKTAVQQEIRPDEPAKDLTPEQQRVMDEINGSEDAVYLLRGVTGSGKTEIYLQLAAAQLAAGRQVLFLVPEISLTPQMIERVSRRFGSRLAVYHSGLNAQQKYEQYRLVSAGSAAIVVGTRSAVFLPFENLGLIIIDEEHDASYKQDSQPCYHCRDIALWRGRYHSCKVILGSATPSLESYARAVRHVYHLVELETRINGTMPKISLVPMRTALRRNESAVLSDLLKEKLQKTLANGEQAILMLNRRGYHSALRCRSCDSLVMCPHCDLAMSYHKDQNLMKCHTCGAVMKVPRICPSCKSTNPFTTRGFGTQMAEEALQQAFPQARILRMDADTTAVKDGHRKILTAFANKEADILLGTQMIAKGLDYPDVTLVGVINGDDGLGRLDYRSSEVTFDLLMQASGRSGRADREGEVVLQVYDPEHYAVQCAIRQDYRAFFVNEMNFRHAGQYPPYFYFISLTVSSVKQEHVEMLASAIRNGISGSFKVIGVIQLLKIRDLYRSRVLLKGRDLDEMKRAVEDFLKNCSLSLKGLKIDVSPLTLD